MKEIRYKSVEDVIEDYIELSNEQLKIPLLIEKAQEKYEALECKQIANKISHKEAEDAFKIFTLLKKYEDRKKEVNEELVEVERVLKEFIIFLKESKIFFEKKGANKTKHIFLFYLQDGQLKCIS